MTQREKIEVILAPWRTLIRSEYEGTRLFKDNMQLVDHAINQIETLITEGKIEEVKRLEFTVTATERAIGGEGGNIKLGTLEAYTKLRIAELQASLKGKQAVEAKIKEGDRGMKNDLREKLAAIEHERWAHWQKWMHSRGEEYKDGLWYDPDLIAAWDRQIKTPYLKLSEREKRADREQVDRYWPLIEEYILALLDEVMGKVNDPTESSKYIPADIRTYKAELHAAIQSIRDSVSGGKK